MQGIIKNVLVNQVKNILIRSIYRLADENKVDTLFLKISSQDEKGTPRLMIYNQEAKLHHEIPFGQLVTPFDKNVYMAMGFNIENELPKWIQKFLVKCSQDNKLLITDPFYLIAHEGNDLRAFMYLNNQPQSEIPIDYILTTK